jgi:1-acyl-sn-glycerol-3-phosphate acyltransferase
MKRFLASVFLRLAGWEPEGRRPAARRYVLIAAPHTSNWDLAYLLALSVVLDVKVSFMAKHTLFRGPLGWAMRRLGGIAIRRHQRENRVDQMARVLNESETLCLAVPAEGTRSYVPHWKSGFYHIARRARVPIVMGYLDYARKRGGFGPELIPTGDVREDMDEVRSFYADKIGKHPAHFGTVRLKEEM